MASSLSGFGRQNAFVSVAASQTDSVVVAALTSRKVRVIALAMQQGDTTASTATLNTKGSGAGTAISPAFKGAANDLLVLPECKSGWFSTLTSEGLTVTTGAGSTTGIAAICEVVQ